MSPMFLWLSHAELLLSKLHYEKCILWHLLFLMYEHRALGIWTFAMCDP